MRPFYQETRDQAGNIVRTDTALRGAALLQTPELNKGTAFTPEERDKLGLLGKLPEKVETLDEQVARTYSQYCQKSSDLQKNIYLNAVNDCNETLFYRLVGDHLDEMLPIIYTPTVGDAVKDFSLELRRPRGLFISYPEMDQIEEILENRLHPEVDIIVATDGEGVLGIGDQGVGGMDISIAKLMVYTLCGGMHPHRRLPIQLDVGTNNQALLNDPMYLGWRHERITGSDYDAFIDRFVNAVKKKLPSVYLHWEDFGRGNARKNLNRYRDQICSFNDDIQGTGAVALAAILAGISASEIPIADHKVVIFGAGTAGVGIADQICDAFVRNGIPEEAARRKFYLIDRQGLLVDAMPELMDFQKPYAVPAASVTSWSSADDQGVQLAEVVKQAKPTILIGCSTVTGAFSESIVKCMKQSCSAPIILPLSNPTSKAEAKPIDLMQWTNDQALIATGSPFGFVDGPSGKVRVSQCNNALVFPGIGLGVIIAKARKVTDNMLWAASQTLSKLSTALSDTEPGHPLLPDFSSVIANSRTIAKAVANQAIEDGVAAIDENTDLDCEIRKVSWEPVYRPYC